MDVPEKADFHVLVEPRIEACEEACDRRLASGGSFLDWRDCKLACAGIERAETCPGTLSPPPGWSSGCSLDGTSSECDLSCGNWVLDGSDFDALSTAEIHEMVNIDSAFSLTEMSLIKSAWAVLVANTDLVEWARCWVKGNDPTWDSCLVDRIQGQRGTLDIVSDWDWGDTKRNATTRTLYGLGATVVLWGNPDRGFSNAVSAWEDDETNAAGVHVGRMCASLYLAVLFLHELIHVCWQLDAVRDNPNPGECDKTYLIQNAFGWALFHRYPDAKSSLCCSGLGDDFHFGYDGSYIFEDDCLPPTVAHGVSPGCLEKCSEEHSGDVEAIKRCWRDNC